MRDPLLDLPLLTADGGTATLGQMADRQPLLAVFLRHFG